MNADERRFNIKQDALRASGVGFSISLLGLLLMIPARPPLALVGAIVSAPGMILGLAPAIVISQRLGVSDATGTILPMIAALIAGGLFYCLVVFGILKVRKRRRHAMVEPD
jgi:predicted permease